MQVAGKGLFRLHPLIEQFLERKMAEAGQQQEMRQGFVDVLVAIAQDVPSQPTLAEVAELGPTLPHLKAVANKFCGMLSGEDLIWPFSAIARFYDGQGLYGLAEPWYEQSVEITRSALGEEHPDYAISVNNLAGLYCAQGRYGEAEPLYLKALGIKRSALGEEHTSYATSLNNLAGLYKSQGRYREAEPLYLKALEITRSALGEEHLSYAISLNDLAVLYRAQGRYGEAEPLYLKALETRRSALGEEHPDYAVSLHNLAGLYKSQGRYGEAEPLYLKDLEITRSALGEEHTSYATSLNNLAGLYCNSFKPWKWFKAIQLVFQCLRITLRTLGWRHQGSHISIFNVFAALFIPAVLTGLLTQGLLISLKIHSILPLLQSVMGVLLVILINRSGIEGRLWAKGKYKLSKYKSRKSSKNPPKRQT
ncbi:MAG: tetratricopeptide repeat protein [Alkalinema sp. FL-bin-369]|nr:tetratricopeptide repeat protein [Leptolyngbyaceae cyanobacterium LF-bin-369]